MQEADDTQMSGGSLDHAGSASVKTSIGMAHYADMTLGVLHADNLFSRNS
jgi:hypothetical protein